MIASQIDRLWVSAANPNGRNQKSEIRSGGVFGAAHQVPRSNAVLGFAALTANLRH
jgi:hypothetical protein